jgi:hypothetical protein
VIEIKSRWDSSKVLYIAKDATDIRKALEEAVEGDANLGGANLRGANLRGANLGDANLGDANLGDANQSIDGPSHPLWAFRLDYWSILDQAPAEVAALREVIVDGRINGSVYNDESGCGCLNGTIAILRECDVDDLPEQTGIVPSSSRPAEQWYIAINKGDKPLPLDTKEWPSEGVFRVSCALAWLDEWVESRMAIASALTKGEK